MFKSSCGNDNRVQRLLTELCYALKTIARPGLPARLPDLKLLIRQSRCLTSKTLLLKHSRKQHRYPTNLDPMDQKKQSIPKYMLPSLVAFKYIRYLSSNRHVYSALVSVLFSHHIFGSANIHTHACFLLAFQLQLLSYLQDATKVYLHFGNKADYNRHWKHPQKKKKKKKVG